MRLLSVIVGLVGVSIAVANKKKLHRGKKIFGKDALHHGESQCSCATSSNCWLVGDPHLKSFYNKYEQVAPDQGDKLNIYTLDGFEITCTTYGRDLMDNIHFGNSHEWHIDDCNGREGWLEEKTHTYSDGSTITAKVYCKKSRRGKKMHINLLLVKSVELQEAMSFEDYESFIESTGVCTNKN